MLRTETRIIKICFYNSLYLCKISIEIIYVFQETTENKKRTLYVYTVGEINEKTNTCKYSYKHYIVIYIDSLRGNAFSI
ncbi:hypothetical protein BAC7755_03960 [Bacillus sp. MN7755]